MLKIGKRSTRTVAKFLFQFLSEVLLGIREIKVTSSDVNAHVEVRYSHRSLVVVGGGVL